MLSVLLDSKSYIFIVKLVMYVQYNDGGGDRTVETPELQKW